MPSPARHPGDPTKTVSDITIRRVYEVECDDCGVVDATRTYADAIKGRREHFDAAHQDRKEA